MKKLLIFTVALSFIGIAVFGFIAMDHENGHDYNSCIVKTINNGNCPNEINNMVNLAILHADAFKGFSMAVLNKNILAEFLIFIFLILSAKIFSALFSVFQTRIAVLPRRIQLTEFFYPPEKINLIRWLSLKENSPSFFS